jgi:hypothetical protein
MVRYTLDLLQTAMILTVFEENKGKKKKEYGLPTEEEFDRHQAVSNLQNKQLNINYILL